MKILARPFINSQLPHTCIFGWKISVKTIKNFDGRLYNNFEILIWDLLALGNWQFGMYIEYDEIIHLPET